MMKNGYWLIIAEGKEVSFHFLLNWTDLQVSSAQILYEQPVTTCCLLDRLTTHPFGASHDTHTFNPVIPGQLAQTGVISFPFFFSPSVLLCTHVTPQ